jgi:hypothetical protein
MLDQMLLLKFLILIMTCVTDMAGSGELGKEMKASSPYQGGSELLV